MSRPKPWAVLRTEFLQDCKVFSVTRTEAVSPRTGRSHPFHVIDAADWVNIVPITPEGDVVLIHQYRHGLRDLTLEIPGGIIDPGETPVEAAARELLEETGHRATEMVSIGTTSPNPAIFSNRVHTFLAKDVERVGEVSNPGTEETVVEIVSAARLRQLAREGGIDHALVLAALHFLDLYREKELL